MNINTMDENDSMGRTLVRDRPSDENILTACLVLEQLARSNTVLPDRIVHCCQTIIAQKTKTLQTKDPVLCVSERAPNKKCYVCRHKYQAPSHAFYYHMCRSCGDRNHDKRTATADLSGRTCLVTGGRIKIGYRVALKLLRAGATVIVTTRFPVNATARYAGETDFADFAARLSVYGLDLCSLKDTRAFCRHLRETIAHLDVLINNAAQTIYRPPEFYAHLLPAERLPAAVKGIIQTFDYSPAPLTFPATETPGAVDMLSVESSSLSAIPSSKESFPEGCLDRDGQQVDLRRQNTWVQPLAEVTDRDLAEVHMINFIAPFILVRDLRDLMVTASPSSSYVINVSAMEGRFSKCTKTGFHPHTNTAKAALNMLTRTCAADFARDNVYMNSVDTGWITNEYPHGHPLRQVLKNMPLDEEDGAARILDPVFTGVAGAPCHGHFFKDYASTTW